jgi:hypothetical protein
LESPTELKDSCPTESSPSKGETDEVKAAVVEFDREISCRFKEEEDLTYDGAKPNPEDWSEYLQYDPNFQEEFNNIVNDPGILEADKDFTPDGGYTRYLHSSTPSC